MSGTPKWCTASFEAERRRQAEAERAREAALEAARRAAEELRQSEIRRDHIRGKATEHSNALVNRLQALESGPLARFLQQTASGIRVEVRIAADESRNASTEATAQACARRVAELATRVEQLLSQAQSTKQAADDVATVATEAELELTRAMASPAGRYLPPGVDWAWRIGQIRDAVNRATDAEGVRVIAVELGGIRVDVRRAVAQAEGTRTEVTVAQGDLQKLRAQIDAFGRGELRAFAEPNGVEQLVARASRTAAELDRATGAETVTAIRREIAMIQDDLKQLAEAAAAAQRSAHLARPGCGRRGVVEPNRGPQPGRYPDCP